MVLATGLEFGLLEAGGIGPLALCLHGFPDTARTWRYQLPELLDAGDAMRFRAEARSPQRSDGSRHDRHPRAGVRSARCRRWTLPGR
jgi:pimeloyl-ACP methyl ester carboxylesterase